MLQLKDAEDKRAAEQLYALLSQWAANGAAVPFSLSALDRQEVSTLVPAIFQKAAGSAWNTWTSARGAEPQESDTLPRQLVLHVHAALVRLHAEFLLQAETRKAAQQSFVVLCEAHKKRKAI